MEGTEDMTDYSELVKVYDEAWIEAYDSLAYDVSKEDEQAKRAGIRAVVTALRDESGRRGYLNWDDLNEILGDAGNEKVAGGQSAP